MTAKTPVILGAGAAFLLLLPLVGARGAGSKPGRDDPRLGRRVSLKLTHPPLPEALADLRRQSGVDLECEPELADRRLVLLARERPLGEVMGQIARFLGAPPGAALWERRRRGADPAYRLLEDLASRQSRLETGRRLARETRARFEEALRLASLPDEELAAHRARHPRLVYRMAAVRPLIQLAGSLPAAVLERVYRGESVRLAYQQLNPAQQARVRELVRENRYSSGRKLPDGTFQTEFSFDGRTDYPQVQLEINRSGTPDRPGINFLVRTSRMSASGSPNLVEPPLPRELRPAWLEEALAAEAARDRKRPVRGAGDRSLEQRVTLRKWVTAGEDEPEPGRRRDCFPADALRQIAEQTGLPIIADYDPGYESAFTRRFFRGLKEDLVRVPLREALAVLEEVWGLTWDRQGGWLRVRSPAAPYAALGVADLSPPWVRRQAPPPDGEAARP